MQPLAKLLGVIRRKPSAKLLGRLVDEIDAGNLSGLAIFDVPDVSFLTQFPTLRYLELRPTAKLELSPLAGLDNLRGLRLENPGSALDFASFPLLEEFVGDWHPKNTGIPGRVRRADYHRNHCLRAPARPAGALFADVAGLLMFGPVLGGEFALGHASLSVYGRWLDGGIFGVFL
jgi:hypothetical protein